MTIYEAPSLVGLIFKVILLTYAARAPVRTSLTRLFVALLVLLSAFNVVELIGLRLIAIYGLGPKLFALGYAYFFLFIPCLAIFLHISLRLSLNITTTNVRWVPWVIYAPAVALDALLLFTNKLVIGFQADQNSALRIPGDWYFLFETFALVYIGASICYLVYGALRKTSPINALRSRLWLLALTPTVALFGYLIVMHHFSATKLTATTYTPLAITFFLVVATYATHHHRLFDIQFYIPWSKTRQRKTAFYDRIRAMIAEIADLTSVNQAVERLAETLRCPVVLVGGPKPVLAASGACQMSTLPLEQLRAVDRILVTNEIVDAMPQMHCTMKQHGIAAVVPFYPHSQNASSWLLLGDSFSEQVYTPLDFRMVEQLFDRMAELFLDKLVAMRTQLAEAHSQIQSLELRLKGTEANVATLETRLETLVYENTRLVREQPADSLLALPRQADNAISVTLLGRDKTMLKQLRERFPQVEQFAGPDSASFRRRDLPQVLLCEVDCDSPAIQRKFVDLFAAAAQRCAILLYGSGAAAFAFEHRKQLLGGLVEVLPPQLSAEAITRKVEALVRLRQSLTTMADADYPLVGCSPGHQEAVAEARRIAGFREPVCIQGADVNEAVAMAAYIHECAKSSGAFRVLHTAKLLKHEAGDDAGHHAKELDTLLRDVTGGTLMIDNLGALSNETWDQLLLGTNEFANVRLIGACLPSTQSPANLFKPLQAPLMLELPSLRERRVDLPLLIHYYTLQFNLQAGTYGYLNQNEIDELMATEYPAELAGLKLAVFDRLRTKAKQPIKVFEPTVGETVGSDKSLDEYVAEFESRLIAQTLARCGGNKSKAARMLNMRPNTLHYKLDRYGLLADKK